MSFALDRILVDSLHPFLQAAKQNYRLETLRVRSSSSEENSKWQQLELETMTQLNQIGYYQLLHPSDTACGVSKRQWVDALARARKNMHCIFYLLSANPSLCDRR